MATFNGSPNDSAYDAQETAAGTVTVNGTSINANNTDDIAGVIVPGVTIPPGSTITAATMTLNFPSGSFDDPDVTIIGLDAALPNGFTTDANDISVRSQTTASVNWTTTGVGTGTENTPDFSAVVQEIIDRGDWDSGDRIGILFIANSNSSNFRVNSYDNGSDYPILNITYTAPSGGQPARTMHQFRQRV